MQVVTRSSFNTSGTALACYHLWCIYIIFSSFLIQPPECDGLTKSKGPCPYLAVRSFHQGAISPFQVFEQRCNPRFVQTVEARVDSKEVPRNMTEAK